MDYETSEETIPGHARQHAIDVEPQGEQIRVQAALGDESRQATQGYDGFEDLTDYGPWMSGDY